MATIDEIFNAMADEAAEAGHEYLVIDPETRTITVPESERIFGVTGDDLADRKYFMCPRYVGDGLDLAGMFLTVYFRTATEYEDGYLVDDLAVNGEYVTFSWLLSSSVTEYKGTVQFTVCADLPNTAEKKRPDWNTTMASGEVLEGLDPDVGDVLADTSDVVTQLREMVTAQTAAVEAAGAAQVDVVEAAGAAATAAAQAQIEAKGAATLATIPADYTTLANKTNEQANAIKGHLAGEIVQAGDVSPVEHYLGVKVQGKNLFDTSKIPTATPSVSYAYISEVGADYIVVRTEEGYDGNGYCTVAKTLREACPALEVGKTYVLTAHTESNSTNMYLPGIQKSWIFGKAMVMTEAILNSAMTFYGLSAMEGMGTGDCTISSIQIEEGTEATEYVPYIDPAGVTVTRCGKNLTAHTAETKTDKQHGLSLTRTHNSAMFIVDGTATQMSSLVATSTIMLPPGTYTASVKGLNIIDAGADRVYLWNQPDGKVVQNGIMDGVPKTFTLAAATPVRAELVFAAGSSYSNKIVEIQIERGAAATAFEEYTAAPAMPDESGTVTGLPSLAPTMTLLTDTAGVNMECTYNRDSNAVYAELLAKIAAMSGTN